MRNAPASYRNKAVRQPESKLSPQVLTCRFDELFETTNLEGE